MPTFHAPLPAQWVFRYNVGGLTYDVALAPGEADNFETALVRGAIWLYQRLGDEDHTSEEFSFSYSLDPETLDTPDTPDMPTPMDPDPDGEYQQGRTPEVGDEVYVPGIPHGWFEVTDEPTPYGGCCRVENRSGRHLFRFADLAFNRRTGSLSGDEWIIWDYIGNNPTEGR